MAEPYKKLEDAAQAVLFANREYGPASSSMVHAIALLGEALSAETCAHRDAVLRCDACAARVRTKYREFPLQVTRDAATKPGPLSVPWAVAEKAWAAYAQQYGTDQSVERMAERGGFGWCDMDAFYPAWRDEVDPFRRLEAERDAARESADDWKTCADQAIAERDEMKREAVDEMKREAVDECKSHMRTQDEARVLRERVKALEASHITKEREQALIERLEGVYKERDDARSRCETAESTLSAIRQRAGDKAATLDAYDTALRHPEGVTAVARYIVGEDGAGAEPETTAERLLREEREASEDSVRRAADPTTAEAFATVLGGIRHAVRCTTTPGCPVCGCGAIEARYALSLLERRMGAMARALQKYRPAHPADCPCSTCQEIAAAFTGAPPVFTLEEVERVCGATVSPITTEDVVNGLCALRSTGGAT